MSLTQTNLLLSCSLTSAGFFFFIALATNGQWHLTTLLLLFFYLPLLLEWKLHEGWVWGLLSFRALSLAHKTEFGTSLGFNKIPSTWEVAVTLLWFPMWLAVVNELWAEVMSVNSSSKHQSIYYNLPQGDPGFMKAGPLGDFSFLSTMVTDSSVRGTSLLDEK